jgi:hypothetical protein
VQLPFVMPTFFQLVLQRLMSSWTMTIYVESPENKCKLYLSFQAITSVMDFL